MMTHTVKDFFRDVTQYREEFLKILDGGVAVHATYKKTWDDGFGARGWKLNASIGDTEIIASTRETGQKINTSVFIHDILDHFLSGYGVSGHRSEAMALIQLSKRTGSDPRPDYEQMVKEDIISGRVNGEELVTFLPDNIRSLLPQNTTMTDKERILFLKRTVGENDLMEALVDNFFVLGKAGEDHAVKSWKKLGVNPNKRTDIGLALQKLLDAVDHEVEESDIEMLEACITISDIKCSLKHKRSALSKSVYSTNVA